MKCSTHGGPEPCPSGKWFCGLYDPQCEGHQKPTKRCEEGAADWHYYRWFNPTAANSIIQILRSPAAQRVSFKLGIIKVDGAGLQTVARLVEQGRILVTHEPVLDWSSSYHHEMNAWGVGKRTISTMSQEALVVHEAVHALNDWHHLQVNARDDEAAGYIAQMIYHHHKQPGRFVQPVAGARITYATNTVVLQCGRQPGSKFCDAAVFGLAALIGQSFMTGQAPPPSSLDQLRDAISRHAYYREIPGIRSNSNRSYGGV
ncbi:MAG TPA: hypothetical protein VF179_25755 [Thermoanaerobaculia bacterium]|nr:hypothetical protein [Thermoanaerobaculia bacterium]